MEMATNERKLKTMERHHKKIHFDLPHFISHLISIQTHSHYFMFNCFSSQMVEQSRTIRVIESKFSPQSSLKI